MHDFELWAPAASEVHLHLHGWRRAMPAAGAVIAAPTAAPPAPRETPPIDAAGAGRAAALLAGLGGATNVQRVDAVSSRVRVAVRDDAAIDEAALAALGLRGLVRPGNGVVHLLVGPSADHLAQGLRALAPLG